MKSKSLFASLNSNLKEPRTDMHRIRNSAFILLVSILLPGLSPAADGDLDATYGSSGKNSVSLGASDNVYGSYLQSDGKMIVVGGARPAGNEDFGVARFNADGSLDTGFGTGGIYSLAITPSAADRATSVGVQSDGKIIVGGYTRFASGNDNFAIIRLTTAGVLDSTFGTGGITQVDFAAKSDRAFCLKVLSDDRIAISGWSSLDGFDLDFAVVQLTAAGALDTSFDADGKVMVNVGNVQDSTSAMVIQADGKILLGGQSASSGGPFELALVRLNSNGSIDAGFGAAGVVNFNFPGSTSDNILALQLQGEGKIVASGYSSGSGNAFIARFMATGALDTTFNSTGYNLIDLGSTSDQFIALALQSNSNIVAGGLYVNGPVTDSALARVTSAGVLDGTFATGGKKLLSLGGSNDKIVGLGIQSSGKIVAATQTSEASGAEDFGVARCSRQHGPDVCGREHQSFHLHERGCRGHQESPAHQRQ